jgi:hypothetical protein
VISQIEANPTYVIRGRITMQTAANFHRGDPAGDHPPLCERDQLKDEERVTSVGEGPCDRLRSADSKRTWSRMAINAAPTLAARIGVCTVYPSL